SQAAEEIGGGSISFGLRDKDAAAQGGHVAVTKFWGIDIFVNNSGATKSGGVEDLTNEDFVGGFSLKYFCAGPVTRAGWPSLRESRGSVVNISGVGGRTPGRQFAIGGSVNAALLSFTKSIAELGLRDGVQVNLVNPGTIRTARFQSRLEAVAKEQNLDLE